MPKPNMRERIPDFAEEGTVVGDFSIYGELRKNSIEARWEYAPEMRKIYHWADGIEPRFLGSIETPQFSGKLPPVVFAIDDLRNANTLAAYRLVEDEYGLNYKITFNEVHYIEGQNGKEWRFGQWAQAETLLHELFHHKQQMIGEDPYKPGAKVTHNAEFRNMLEQAGLHCDSDGAHFAPVDPSSPAGILFKEWGLEMPKGIPRGQPLEFDWIKWFAKEYGRERKGRSSLTKYSCECGQNIRVGKKKWPGAECNDCHSQYLPAAPRPRK